MTDPGTPGREGELLSGAPMFTFDAEMRIRSWNSAAEGLTGIPAGEVVGRACWEALCAHDEAGSLVCHNGCSFHRLLRERWPIAPPTLVIKTSTGTRRANVPMVVVEDQSALRGPAARSGSERRAPLGSSGRRVSGRRSRRAS